MLQTVHSYRIHVLNSKAFFGKKLIPMYYKCIIFTFASLNKARLGTFRLSLQPHTEPEKSEMSWFCWHVPSKQERSIQNNAILFLENQDHWELRFLIRQPSWWRTLTTIVPTSARLDFFRCWLWKGMLNVLLKTRKSRFRVTIPDKGLH